MLCQHKNNGRSLLRVVVESIVCRFEEISNRNVGLCCYVLTCIISLLLPDLCRQLIWITNQLDAGHGRLLMYLGVLNYELHSALLELVQRNSKPADNLDKSSNDTKKHKEVKLGNSEASLKGKRGNSNRKKAKSTPTAAEKTEVAPTSVEGKLSRPACMTKEKQSRLVQEAKSLLEENLKLLEHEPPSTTGYDMGVLTKISLGQIDNLLKKYVNDQ